VEINVSCESVTVSRRGRPRSPEPASSRIDVRMTAAQRLALREVASENGMRLSAMVREAVDTWVGDYRDRRVFRTHKK